MLVQLIIMFSSASVTQASAAGTLPVWLVILMFLMLAGLLLVSVYCSVLVMTKRVRNLGFRYPVWLALLTCIANLGALKLNLLLPGPLSDHNGPGPVQFSLYVVIIIWNLYLIAGRSR